MQALGPHQSAIERVRHREVESFDLAALIDAHARRKRGPAALLDPRTAPLNQVLLRPRIEDADQIAPRGIAIRVALEVLAQAVSKRVLADDQFQLAHDDGRLLVDDRAVQSARHRPGSRVADEWDWSLTCDRPDTPPDGARAGTAARDSRSGNDGFTIFAAMKFANTSFIHTSSNQRIVTRSPNHMWDVSCAMTLARSSSWFCVADSSSIRPEAL